MNRRAFLRSLGLVTAAATVDRKYFFAPAAGWTPGPGHWQSFRIELPTPGSFPFEITGMGYILIAGHPVHKIESLWLNRTEVTDRVRFSAQGAVILGANQLPR